MQNKKRRDILIREHRRKTMLEKWISDFFQTFQIAGFVILGLIYLLPSIISGLRRTKVRWIIFILNIVFTAAAYINAILPVVAWLILAIIAITGKKDMNRVKTAGIKIVNVQKEEK